MLKKFFKYAKSHRLGCTFSIIVISLLMALVPQFFYSSICPENSGITRLELLSYCAQIVSSFFVIFGTVVAVWQYYISSTHKINQMDRDCIENAVELAGYYKDNIISDFSIIKGVCKSAGIYDVMIQHLNEMKHFDNWENEQIFSKEELEQISKGRRSQQCFDAVAKYNVTKKLGLFDSSIDVSKLSDKQKEEICNKFWTVTGTNVLNSAEFFAMHFSHEIADDTVIYQSIYPTYLEMCCILYGDIVRCRHPQKAQLYSNVVHLFVAWKEMSIEQKQKAIEMFREASNELGSVVNKRF